MRIELFTPHKGQDAIMTDFINNDAKWGIVVTGRQFGKTLMAINMMIYWLLKDDKLHGAWISPYNKQVEDVFSQITSEAADLIETSSIQHKRIEFKNGSTLRFLSADNYNSIRGFTFDYGVIDEASFVKPDALPVIRPTFAVKGKKVMIISTPKIKNWFYEYYLLGKNEDEPNYCAYHAVSTDNPYFPMEELEAAKATMTDDDIQQEYFAQFRQGGGDVFKNFHYLCKVEQFKSSSAEPCYLGVDIAVTKSGDASCAVILDQFGKVISVDRWRDDRTSTQIQRLRTICNNYNIQGGFIEINTERGIQQAISGEFPLVKDWMTTKKSKPEMIQHLRKDIDDGKLKLPSPQLDSVMYNELAAFSATPMSNGYIKYSHPPGGHDDSVIALALANMARVPNRYNQHRPRFGRMSLKW